jgi:hypothetical protein
MSGGLSGLSGFLREPDFALSGVHRDFAQRPAPAAQPRRPEASAP